MVKDFINIDLLHNVQDKMLSNWQCNKQRVAMSQTIQSCISSGTIHPSIFSVFSCCQQQASSINYTKKKWTCRLCLLTCSLSVEQNISKLACNKYPKQQTSKFLFDNEAQLHPRKQALKCPKVSRQALSSGLF